MTARKVSNDQGKTRLFEAPKPKNSNAVVKFVALGSALMAVGAALSWYGAHDPASVDVAQTGQDSRVHGLEEAVTRALDVDLSAVAAPFTPAADENCAQSVRALVATSPDAQQQTAQLSLARALAIAAQGCDAVMVTIEGHVSRGSDEIENLASSWQQAQGVIDALAGEGLDVSVFQPLGSGSRSFDAADGPAEYVSFQIAPYAAASPG